MTVVADEAFPVTLPSILALRVPAVPVKTLLVSVASVSTINLPSESS